MPRKQTGHYTTMTSAFRAAKERARSTNSVWYVYRNALNYVGKPVTITQRFFEVNDKGVGELYVVVSPDGTTVWVKF